MTKGSRLIRLAAAVLLAAALAPAQAMDAERGWEAFKSRFIEASGRVVDTQNEGMSHSEGQAYALLLAVHHNDPATFARVRSWTRQHLALRDDGLLMWSWDAEREEVDDANAAADGDLIYAWAHALAAERFARPTYRELAREHFARIREHLVVERGGRPYLLPGPEGFVHDRRLTLNPSYWVYGALEAASTLDEAPVWQALIASGERLHERARFTPARLPADWVSTEDGERFRIAERFDPHYGFDAVRVALYLIDAGRLEHPLITAVAEHHAAHPEALVWDLKADGAELEGRHPGVAAVAGLAACATQGEGSRAAEAELAEDYYPAALQLLAARAAERAEGLSCE